jgi:hypothetical protein
MTSALEASGPKKYFFAYSILLDGLAHISAIFPLKMQKSLKSAHPNVQYIRCINGTGKCISGTSMGLVNIQYIRYFNGTGKCISGTSMVLLSVYYVHQWYW